MYKIETSSQGMKFVRVDKYIIYLYSDRIEVTLDAKVIKIIDYMVIDPTKAEKLEILKDTITEYHHNKNCPF